MDVSALQKPVLQATSKNNEPIKNEQGRACGYDRVTTLAEVLNEMSQTGAGSTAQGHSITNRVSVSLCCNETFLSASGEPETLDVPEQDPPPDAPSPPPLPEPDNS